jgi:hypothetical protein
MNIKTVLIRTIFKASIFLLIGSVYSCFPTKSLVIDIPQPSASELPSSIQSVTIVSQAVDKNFTNLHTDSLQKLFFEQRFNLDTVIYDFQMADTTMKALGELLFESGRYDYVIPEIPVSGITKNIASGNRTFVGKGNRAL